MKDDLREQLSKLDPMRSDVRVVSPSRDELENIMQSNPVKSYQPRTRWLSAAAVVGAIAAVAIAVPVLNGDSPGESPAPPALQLSLGGAALQSCIAFDVAILAEMETAFEGTVTNVEGEQVTLVVDHWFTAGEATVVELHAPDGMQALIGGIDFVEGDQYLITAAGGNVNYCGFSGPSTPEFRASFEEAFGS
jgi:hypothetical protein